MMMMVMVMAEDSLLENQPIHGNDSLTEMSLHTNRRNEPEGHVHFILFCARHTGNNPLSN